MSIKLYRKYDFFGQNIISDYNYLNKDFITISTTTMDFTKLQEAATTSKEALAKKTTETQKALEKSFVDAMKSWEDAVKTKEVEASKDTTKSSEALQVRSNFDTFKNNLETEVKNLLNQEQAEKKEVEQQTKTETEKLLDSITKDSIAIISAAKYLYKDKTRADMVNMENLPAYINAFQTIIIQLGASTGLDDKSMDRIGPITRAGVKTIQKYLNDTYQAGLDIDGVPGPKTLEQLLALVSSTDTTTRLEKMFADKTAGKLSLVPEKVVITTPRKTETATNKTENTKKRSNTTPTDKLNNEPAIPLTPEEIDNKDKEKKFQEKKKKILESIRKITGLEKSTDLKSLGITFNEKNETIFGQSGLTRVDENKQDDFTIKLQEGYKVENGKIISIGIDKSQDGTYTENYTNKEKINNNLRIISAKEINQNLKSYINTITFEEPKYLNYYNKNIKNKNINCSYNTLQIGYMYISLQPNDFLKKDNSINYKSLLEIIKTRIKENADLTEKKEEENKITEKYNKLKDYFIGKKTWTWTSFPKKYLYPDFDNLSPGQQNTINAFFEDFKGYIGGVKNDGITFKNPRQTTDKKYIQLMIDEDGNDDKYGDIKISIQNNFNADGSIEKAKIKQELRQLIDIKIKKAFPNYIPTTNNMPNNKKEEANQKTIEAKTSTTKVKDDNINTKGA